MIEEIDDQAGALSDIATLHFQKHGGKADENCEFCKNFLIPQKDGHLYHSYKFIIFDVSNEKNPTKESI